MSRAAGIAALVGLLVGVLVGFLSWGLPERRMQADLRQAQERPAALERELDEAKVQAARASEQLQALQRRLQELEADLAFEREQRGRLEALVSRGRK